MLTTKNPYPMPDRLQAIRESLTYSELRHLAQEVLDRVTPAIYAQGIKDGQAQLLQSQRDGRERRKIGRGKRAWVSVVYFVRSPTAIKIGRSKDAPRRVTVLQTSHPEPLELIATVEGGRDLESEYHARFGAHRLHGEWFSPHPEILDEIARLQPLQSVTR